MPVRRCSSMASSAHRSPSVRSLRVVAVGPNVHHVDVDAADPLWMRLRERRGDGRAQSPPCAPYHSYPRPSMSSFQASAMRGAPNRVGSVCRSSHNRSTTARLHGMRLPGHRRAQLDRSAVRGRRGTQPPNPASRASGPEERRQAQLIAYAGSGRRAARRRPGQRRTESGELSDSICNSEVVAVGPVSAQVLGYASGTPCDQSSTVSRPAHRMLVSRCRRPSIAAAATLGTIGVTSMERCWRR